MTPAQPDTPSTHWFDHIIKYSLLTLLLVGGISLFWLNSEDKLSLMTDTLFGPIYQENQRFIAAASDRAESMLVILSELHSGLMVLQSSEFGISFIVDANVQLGHVLSQVTDLVSHGRNYALYNLVALHLIDNMMHITQWLTPWLLLVSATTILCLVIADSLIPSRSRWHMSLIRFCEATLATSLLILLIIPLSISVVSLSSKAVTQALYSTSYQAISDTHRHILQDTDTSSIKSEASNALSQFKAVKIKVSEKLNYLSSHITRYIAIAVLEVFLLPLALCGVIFWLLKNLIRRHRHWQK